jgi:hypothetical protein
MAVEFEPLFMNVHETTIAWMHSIDKIQVIDVSGGIRGMKGKFRKIRKPIELKCDIIGKNEQRKDINTVNFDLVVSFKISAQRGQGGKSGENKGKKRIVIVTRQDMYVIPFSLGQPLADLKENEEEKEDDE